MISGATRGRKQVLILNQYYPPDTSATALRVAEVAGALAGRFDVRVIAGRPSYGPDIRHPYYLWRSEPMGAVSVERVGSTAFSRRTLPGRIANYTSYLGLTLIRAMRTDADVLISMTDPPLIGVLGAAVARIRGKRFVYNIRDLHPDMAVASGMIRRTILTDLWDRAHSWAMRRAHSVVVLGEDMRERVIAKGVEPNRIVVVRDGAPLPVLPHRADPAVVRAIRGDSRFVAMHAGNLGFSGAWETLIRGRSLVHDPGIGLVFVGGGAAGSAILALARGVEGVRFLPYFPREQISDVLSAADVHIVSVRRGLEGLVVPSKLYPALAAGRPILAVADARSDAARVIHRARCGVVVDPERPEEVARALERMSGDESALAEMGNNARELAREYELDGQLQRFVGTVAAI